MTKLCRIIATSTFLVLSATAFAEDAHHPAGAAPAAPPITTPMPSGPQGMMGAGMMSMMNAGPMAMMGQMMAPERIEGRIAFLKTELKITDAQLAIWTKFAEVLRANARMMSGMQSGMMPAPGAAPQNLPQQIDSHERMLSAHLDALRQLKAALQPLYAVFDDQQKQAANQLLMPGMMGRM